MDKNKEQFVQILEAFTGITLEDICKEVSAKTQEEKDMLHNGNLAKMFDHTSKEFSSDPFKEYMKKNKEPHEQKC